jgi:hypothetical protein
MKRFVLFVVFLCAVDAKASCGSAPSELVGTLLKQAPGLHAHVLKLALDAERCGVQRGVIKRADVLTVIDYSIASTQPRLFVFDLAARRLLFHELVAHGKNSGGNITNFFSNDPGSLATSLGLFVTEDTYVGHNGYSLRLRGLEQGFNDMAFSRAIVLHGAYYVSQQAAKVLGRLGRSWGCPAVRAEVAHKLIDTIRGGSAIFAYYPEQSWLMKSAFLH